MIEIDKLTEQQSLIKEFVDKLSKEYDSQYFLDNLKDEKFPEELWNVISDGGYMGMIVPEEYGGSSLNVEDLILFVGHMAANGLVSYQLVNQVICCYIISTYGNDEQKHKYLPEIIAGVRCSYASMEQSCGLSIYDINMKAVKEGNNYILNGAKSYAVGAKGAKYLIVSARTSDGSGDNKEQGISLFILDSDSQGLEITSKEINVRVTTDVEPMQITGDTFYDVNFNNVSVPTDNLVGQENCGGEYLHTGTSLLMLMIAAKVIGWSDTVIDMAVDYAKDRVIFEEPIGSYQAIQHPLVKAKTEVELAKLAVKRAAYAYDNKEEQQEINIYSNVAKYMATEAAYKAFDIAIQSHGGYSFDRGTGIITLWPLILLSRIIPLNNDVILEHFSEEVIGLPVN